MSNVDAIIIKTDFVCHHNDPTEDAKYELSKAISDVTLDCSKDLIRVGNSKGLSLMEKMNEMLRRMDEIEKLKMEISELKQYKIKTDTTLSELGSRTDKTDIMLSELGSKTDTRLSKLGSKTDKTDTRLSKVQSIVSQVASESGGFMSIRNRFFATFLRDRFNNRVSQTDRNIIKDGNKTAHHGGQLPFMTIDIMDKHATELANADIHLGNLSIDIYLETNKNSSLGQLHVAFLAFISKAKKNGFTRDLSEEDQTYQDICKHYDKF